MKSILALALFGLIFPASRAETERVIARTAHEATYQRIETTVENGETNEVAHQWIHLQNGLNYWSPEKRDWSPTTTTIELAEVGAIYRQGPFKVRFAPNQNDLAGSVELTLPFPDERKLKIQTIGIALSDGGSGESVWLGELRDSNGLLEGNSVLYPDAFTQVRADILLRVETGELHHDVVFREFPLQAGLLNALNFDESKTRLEIWHQILETPDMDVRPGQLQRSDGTTDFDQQFFVGDMFFGPGTAFLLGTNHFPIAAAEGRLPVAKELFRDPQSKLLFLIESVRLSEALPHLVTLPAKQQASINAKGLRQKLDRERMIAGNSRRQPTRMIAAKEHQKVEKKVASIRPGAIPRSPGYSIDYVTISSAANTRLAGNSTYYVSSSVVLSSQTTIEKGAVVKLATGSALLLVTGTVDCQTSLGMPLILTARDDDSVGETISGSSGTPSGTYGTYHMLFSNANATSLNLHDIHARFAQVGIGLQGTNSHTLANIQAISCTRGIDTKNNQITVHNYLTHNTAYPIVSQSATSRVEHATAHLATQMFYDFGGSALYLTNSLLVGVTYASTNLFTDHVTTFTTDQPSLFTTVKAGSHYLSESGGLSYRNAGTSSLDTNMQAILNVTTTYPPVEVTNTIFGTRILYPQAQRDTDAPDLGAHFAPIDYIWGGLTIGENASLILSNGVSAAMFGTNATMLMSGATVLSEGLPQALNRITRYQAIQEQPTLFGTQPNTLFMITNSPAIRPRISLRFTQIFTPAHTSGGRYFCSGDFGEINSRDSEWWNIYCFYEPLAGITSSYSMTNNIFGRCDFSFLRNSQTHQMTLGLWNNLFIRSALTLSYVTTSSSPPTWTVKDNLFETSTFSGSTVANIVCGYNGYFSTTIPGCSAGNDKTVTTLDFQSISTGAYYYPTNGTGNLSILIGTGSRTVGSATLVPYTVQPDQAKDTGTVDIGFHYLALSGGIPLDGDSDGISDYREDVNMDGTIQSGEGNPASALDQGLTIQIFQPRTTSILP